MAQPTRWESVLIPDVHTHQCRGCGVDYEHFAPPDCDDYPGDCQACTTREAPTYEVVTMLGRVVSSGWATREEAKEEARWLSNQDQHFHKRYRVRVERS